MKKLLYLSVYLIVWQSLPAQEISFINGDWKEALQTARMEDKYIFLDAYTDWCYWCKVMDKKTFTDPEVAQFMEDHYVSLKLDMEKEGIPLAMKYHVTGFPSFLIFDKEGRLLYRTTGYQPPEEFMEVLEEGVNEENHMRAIGYSTSLDLPYPEFYRNVFDTNRVKPGEGEVDRYLLAQEDLLSEVNWAVMMRFQTNEEINTFFLDHFDQYRRQFGRWAVQRKLSQILHTKLDLATAEKDETLLRETLGMIDRYYEGDKEEQKLFFQTIFYKETGDWKSVTAYMEELVELTEYVYTNYINSQSWYIYENVDDERAIDAATEWMAQVVVLEPEYAFLDTYAALLYKSGQLKMAEKIALRAIEAGEEAEEDITVTEELLEKIREAGK